MKTICELSDLPRALNALGETPGLGAESGLRTVAAIGNFDGVHRGHREIIGRVLDRARSLDALAIAVTFDPHPMALLHPEHAPKLITPMPERLRLLEQTGLHATVVIPFTREFSMQTP